MYVSIYNLKWPTDIYSYSPLIRIAPHISLRPDVINVTAYFVCSHNVSAGYCPLSSCRQNITLSSIELESDTCFLLVASVRLELCWSRMSSSSHLSYHSLRLRYTRFLTCDKACLKNLMTRCFSCEGYYKMYCNGN
jgi:hypothetical protein